LNYARRALNFNVFHKRVPLVFCTSAKPACEKPTDRQQAIKRMAAGGDLHLHKLPHYRTIRVRDQYPMVESGFYRETSDPIKC